MDNTGDYCTVYSYTTTLVNALALHYDTISSTVYTRLLVVVCVCVSVCVFTCMYVCVCVCARGTRHLRRIAYCEVTHDTRRCIDH